MQSNLLRAIGTIRVRFGDHALVRATRRPAARPRTTGRAAIAARPGCVVVEGGAHGEPAS